MEGYSEKLGFLVIEKKIFSRELTDKIGRSGRFNMFQTNLENKLLKIAKWYYFHRNISDVLESRRNSRDAARPKI